MKNQLQTHWLTPSDIIQRCWCSQTTKSTYRLFQFDFIDRIERQGHIICKDLIETIYASGPSILTVVCCMRIGLRIAVILTNELLIPIIQLNTQPFKELIHSMQDVAIRRGHSDEIISFRVILSSQSNEKCTIWSVVVLLCRKWHTATKQENQYTKGLARRASAGANRLLLAVTGGNIFKAFLNEIST